MEYNKQIGFMNPGDEVEGFYVLKSASKRVTSTGKPFLNISLADAGDVIEAKVWDYSGPIGEADAGKIVKIRGAVQEYKGSSQISVERIRLATENDSYDLSAIVPTAPIDSIQEIEFIRKLITGIEDRDYRTVCNEMLDRHIASFGRIPAGISVHHSFLSGLLMHTGNMLRIADFLATEIYPYAVDRSLLLAGTLLHDFAKEREYVITELGLMTDRTVEGMLLGHLYMCAEEVGSVGIELGIPDEKITLLKHLILSHHGEPEHGAAVIPCTAESELLSYIDLIDSRMEIYAETFEKLDKGKVSDKIWALEKKIYNHE